MGGGRGRRRADGRPCVGSACSPCSRLGPASPWGHGSVPWGWKPAVQRVYRPDHSRLRAARLREVGPSTADLCHRLPTCKMETWILSVALIFLSKQSIVSKRPYAKVDISLAKRWRGVKHGGSGATFELCTRGRDSGPSLAPRASCAHWYSTVPAEQLFGEWFLMCFKNRVWHVPVPRMLASI